MIFSQFETLSGKQIAEFSSLQCNDRTVILEIALTLSLNHTKDTVSSQKKIDRLIDRGYMKSSDIDSYTMEQLAGKNNI